MSQPRTSRVSATSLMVIATAALLSGCVTVAPGSSSPSIDATQPPLATSSATETPERTRRPCEPGDTRPRCQTAAPATAPPTDTPTPTPTPTDTPTPTPTPTATPTAPVPTGSTGGTPTDITISTLQIDFGTVNSGATATVAVTLTNSGSDPFGPINMFGGAPPTAEFNAAQNCQAQTLPAGGSCMVQYSFSPTAAGTYIDFSIFTISETANQSDGEDFTVALYGVGGP